MEQNKSEIFHSRIHQNKNASDKISLRFLICTVCFITNMATLKRFSVSLNSSQTSRHGAFCAVTLHHRRREKCQNMCFMIHEFFIWASILRMQSDDMIHMKAPDDWWKIYINKPFSVDCSDFFSDDTGNRRNCSCSSFRIRSSRCFYGAIYIFNIIKFHARLKRTTREILKINLMIFSNRISA